MVFAFGQFELDVGARELRRNGHSVPLQPRVFSTLLYLVEHRDRVVSKQELIDALWDGAQLNPVAVPWSISHARRALGQRGRTNLPIETVRGRGYRFVASVQSRQDGPASRLRFHRRFGEAFRRRHRQPARSLGATRSWRSSPRR